MKRQTISSSHFDSFRSSFRTLINTSLPRTRHIPHHSPIGVRLPRALQRPHPHTHTRTGIDPARPNPHGVQRVVRVRRIRRAVLAAIDEDLDDGPINDPREAPVALLRVEDAVGAELVGEEGVGTEGPGVAAVHPGLGSRESAAGDVFAGNGGGEGEVEAAREGVGGEAGDVGLCKTIMSALQCSSIRAPKERFTRELTKIQRPTRLRIIHHHAPIAQTLIIRQLALEDGLDIVRLRDHDPADHLSAPEVVAPREAHLAAPALGRARGHLARVLPVRGPGHGDLGFVGRDAVEELGGVVAVGRGWGLDGVWEGRSAVGVELLFAEVYNACCAVNEIEVGAVELSWEVLSDRATQSRQSN